MYFQLIFLYFLEWLLLTGDLVKEVVDKVGGGGGDWVEGGVGGGVGHWQGGGEGMRGVGGRVEGGHDEEDEEKIWGGTRGGNLQCGRRHRK